MKSPNEILRICMSQPYCGATRYDYLDPEEIIMILEAMELYANEVKNKK